MSRIRTYTLAQQEAIVRRYVLQGSYRLSALLHRKREEICGLAIQRLVTLGHDEYGDEMFHQSFDQLEVEALEELADGCNRQGVYSWRESLL